MVRRPFRYNGCCKTKKRFLSIFFRFWTERLSILSTLSLLLRQRIWIRFFCTFHKSFLSLSFCFFVALHLFFLLLMCRTRGFYGNVIYFRSITSQLFCLASAVMKTQTVKQTWRRIKYVQEPFLLDVIKIQSIHV